MYSAVITAYISLMIAGGSAILIHGAVHWRTANWVQYLAYFAMGLIASGMKVRLPGVTGTMSMSFLFVLIGILELSQPETVALGCAGMVVQCLLHARRRPRAVQVLFNAASMAVSVAASYQMYHLALLPAHMLETPVGLLLAAATFFVTNTLSITIVIALTERKRIWGVWRGTYFWLFPNYVGGAAVAVMISAASRLFGWQTAVLLLPILYVIYRSHSTYVSRLEEEKEHAEEQRRHAEEMAAVQRRTITALALAIEAKDQTTHDHLERVETYAVEVGKELGLSGPQLEALRASALLHDIGKLAVPEYIISKPGRLTPEEFEKMKIHPMVGAEIIEQVQFPYPVAPIVRAHHEKWDGSGYPDGLASEQIPIGARILSAVDCLDALASDRQYRRAMPLDEAIKIVQAGAGKSFDPRVVGILARRYAELEGMAKSGGPGGKARLSVDTRVERGAAPAAGFETIETPAGASCDMVSLHRSLAEPERQTRWRSELIDALDRCQGVDAMFAVLRERIGELIPHDVMALYRRSGERLVAECVSGEEFRQLAGPEIRLGTGLSGWAAENGKPIVNGNPCVEPGYLTDPARLGALHSALAVPLKGPGGSLGVLSLYHRDQNAFTKEHLNLLLLVEPRLARALESARRELEGVGGRE